MSRIAQIFQNPLQLLYTLPAIIIGLTVHEWAHAYAAYRLGDPTARNLGRMTLNPLAHIDIFGFLMLILVGFGWAKPVPVNPHHFKNPRLAGILVSAAGPLSNLLLTAIGFLAWYSMARFGVMDLIPDWFAAGFETFFSIFIGLNALLFVFNLLPFPPLDGYRIIEDLSPRHLRAKMTQWENYGALIFLILVLTPLDRYTIHPIFNVAVPFVLDRMQTFFSTIFF